MKKEFNNKGMTLVELIITFSLLMIVVVGMFNLILDIKLDMDDKQIIKSYIDYSSYYSNILNYDFVRNKPFMVFIKDGPDSVTCASSDATSCESVFGTPAEGETSIINSLNKIELYCNDNDINDCHTVKSCVKRPGETPAYAESYCIDTSTKVTFTEMCRRIYPCLIGAYRTNDSKEPIKYMAVAINVPSGSTDAVADAGGEGGATSTTTEAPLDKSKYGLGINYYYYKKNAQGSKYQNVYEQIPNLSYVYMDNDAYTISFGSGSANDDIEGNSVSQNSVVIDFPIYKTGNDTNYGFKVIYPLVKQ